MVAELLWRFGEALTVSSKICAAIVDSDGHSVPWNRSGTEESV